MGAKIDGLNLRFRGEEEEKRSREHVRQPLVSMEDELNEARSTLAKRVLGCREFLLDTKQELQVIIETDGTRQIRTARKLLPVILAGAD